MMYGTYHLNYGLTFVDYFFLSVQPYDCQLSLLHNTVVHDWMMMPTQFLSCRELIAHNYQLRLSLWIVWQQCSVPALVGTEKFRSLDLLGYSLASR